MENRLATSKPTLTELKEPDATDVVEQAAGLDLVLAQRLFVPIERCGWEYQEPEPPVSQEMVTRPPAMVEVPKPELRWLEGKVERIPLHVVIRLAFSAVAVVIAILTPWEAWLAPLVFAAGMGFTGSAIVVPIRRVQRVKQAYEDKVETAELEFVQARDQWQAEVDERAEEEELRLATEPRWFPLRLTAGWNRVDVFGGTGDGWASLLGTLGPSILENHSDVLVLDFSEQNVAEDLAMFADHRGLNVSGVELPAWSSQLDLLAGLSAEEVGELVADAVHSLRSDRSEVELRALDADLIEAVADRLTGPVTFTRLAAGVRVLRRLHEGSGDEALSPDEIRSLNAYVDTAGASERVVNELQFLNEQLKQLGRDENDQPVETDAEPSVLGKDGLWPAPGLVVLMTASANHRRKDLLDRIIFHRVLQELRRQRRGSSDSVIVVAGADHLGLQSLEELSRQAKRVGVRLVLLMEHLREDLQQLLGTSNSVSIVMRLGNHKEATAAADFIGKGYKFVVSQLSEQVGKTFTEGTGRSEGSTDSFSHGTSDSDSGGTSHSWAADGALLKLKWDASKSKNHNWSTSSSRTYSRANTWQDTVNSSIADSTNTGKTDQRVYEYAVEPTTIQSLAPTVCFLIDPGAAERRVVVADCNPGISLLDGVASESLQG